jgi:tetratricopeptide (TPR) repeat protein
MEKKQDQMKTEFEERKKQFLANRRAFRKASAAWRAQQRRNNLVHFGKRENYDRHVRKARKPDPEKSKKLHKIAEIYSGIGMADEAHNAVRQAYWANPDNQDIVEQLAKYYIREKKYASAKRYAEKLCKLYNGKAEGEFLLGQIYFYQGEWLLAKKYLLSVTESVGMEVFPDSSNTVLAEIHCMIATCCKELGDDAASLVHLTEALEYAPRNANTLFQLGMHYAKNADEHVLHLWRYANSKAEARKAVKKAQSVERSPAKTRIDNLRKAEDFFRRSAKLKQTSAVYNNLAHTLSLLNKHSKALTIIEKSLRIKPDPFILVTKGGIQFRMENLTDALDTVNQALDLDNQYLGALKLKSQVQKNLKDWAGYYETNLNVAKLSEDPNDKGVANANMAQSFMERRDFKKANSILNKYLKENPASHSVLHRKFDCAIETGEFSQALDLANEIYKINPNVHSEKLKLHALVSLGKKKKAFRLAVKLADSPDLDPLTANNVINNMYNHAHGFSTRNKKNIPIIRSACKKIEKRFGKSFRTIQLSANELLNWINAITGKEKEFDRHYIKIKKMRGILFKIWKKERGNRGLKIPDMISHYANNDYNYACAFALAGNTNKALQLLKIAIKSDQKYRRIAKKDKDFQNLFESKKFIELTHEKRKS